MEETPQRLIENPNLRDQIYGILKRMIVRREIAPGEKISEEKLARRIGVSRTPVREVLCRLEREGIVENIPRRGAFVVRQSRETIEEILQVREVLEGLVVRLVAPVVEESTLQRLDDCFTKVSTSPEQENQIIEYSDADVEFHAILQDACPNMTLRNMMEMVNAHLQMIRLRTVVLPGRAKQSFQEHRKIIDAIVRRDAERAEALMREHIANVRRAAMENIGRML